MVGKGDLDFLVVGELCLDIDIIPGVRGRQTEIRSYSLLPAGSAGNTAIALRGFSADVSLLYPASQDHVDRILSDLMSLLDLSLIKIYGRGDSCVVVNIISRKGSRRAYTSKGPLIEGLEEVALINARFLHISGYLLELSPVSSVAKTVREMRDRSMVSLDLFPRVSSIGWDRLSDVIKNTHVVFGNREEFRSIGGSVEKAVEKILGLGVDTVIVKMGSKGAALFTGREKIMCPAKKISRGVLKGAGDVFNAAYLYSIYLGLEPGRALEVACEEASNHVAGQGIIASYMSGRSLSTLKIQGIL